MEEEAKMRNNLLQFDLSNMFKVFSSEYRK